MAGTAPFGNPGDRLADDRLADWGRLIPGDEPAVFSKRKLPQPVKFEKAFVDASSEIFPDEPPLHKVLDLLLPRPLQTRTGWKWLQATAFDCALVALNWLMLASACTLIPALRWLAFAVGAPASVLGVALLHSALITLTNYTEGLHNFAGDLKRQGMTLAKSILWATAVLCLAYSLQGTSPWLCALVIAAAPLHFGSLFTWRWASRWHSQNAWHGKTCHRNRSNEIRNVLIVGAGGVGRRIAKYIEAHPETGRAVCGFLDDGFPDHDFPQDDRPPAERVIGRMGDLARLARTGFVDEVLLAQPHDRNAALQVLREARHLRLDVEIVPDLFG